MTRRDVPITRYTHRIVAALREVRAEGDELTLTGLIDVLGPRAHRLLLLVAALFNMLPGPPGFGGTIAWTTFLIALAMVLGRPIKLPRIIGKRKLPLKLMIKASEKVERVANFLARFSKPRLNWITGPAARIPYGIGVMVVSVVMTLPVPLINAIPNVGLCIIAFSMLNRDGLGVLIGVIVTLIGLVVAAAALFGLFQVGGAAFDWLF